jgi:hypothetical protein
MTNTQWIATVTIIAIGVNLLWKLSRIPQQKQALSAMRQAAIARFKELTVPASEPRLELNGKSAEVVLVETLGIDRDSFSCTLYARNQAGEYFMFKTSGEKHWLKHVEPVVAKAVLKNRFIEPSTAIKNL